MYASHIRGLFGPEAEDSSPSSACCPHPQGRCCSESNRAAPLMQITGGGEAQTQASHWPPIQSHRVSSGSFHTCGRCVSACSVRQSKDTSYGTHTGTTRSCPPLRAPLRYLAFRHYLNTEALADANSDSFLTYGTSGSSLTRLQRKLKCNLNSNRSNPLIPYRDSLLGTELLVLNAHEM